MRTSEMSTHFVNVTIDLRWFRFYFDKMYLSCIYCNHHRPLICFCYYKFVCWPKMLNTHKKINERRVDATFAKPKKKNHSRMCEYFQSQTIDVHNKQNHEKLSQSNYTMFVNFTVDFIIHKNHWISRFFLCKHIRTHTRTHTSASRWLTLCGS